MKRAGFMSKHGECYTFSCAFIHICSDVGRGD